MLMLVVAALLVVVILGNGSRRESPTGTAGGAPAWHLDDPVEKRVKSGVEKEMLLFTG
jgi:hypothetical protein